MFSINVSGLDDAIDERFEYNMDIGSHYSGCGLIDDKTGRLVSPMNYHLDKETLLGIVQRQQEQIDEDRNYFNIKIKSLEYKIDMLVQNIFRSSGSVEVLKKELDALNLTGENPKEE